MNLCKILGAAIASLTAFVHVAHADNVFWGQTGQYHVIPYQQDVEKITLFGKPDSSCPNGLALFAADEYGSTDSVPFVVPYGTVLLLSDVQFLGQTSSPLSLFVGQTPMLLVSQSNAYHPLTRAAFFANEQLTGSAGQPLHGQSSLQSGVAYPVNSKLCAIMGPTPAFGTSEFAQAFQVVFVLAHGTVVDNTRTNSYPYLTW